MKKRFFALLCALTLLLGAVPSAAALEGESQKAAGTLAALGLIDGVPSGADLSSPASRLQAVKLLVRLSGADAEELVSGPQDYAAAQGWVTVTGGQKDPIPTGEFCAALLRLLGYEGFTDANAALFARRVALTSRDYGDTLTLGDLYQLVRDALPFPGEDGPSAAERLVEKGVWTQEQVQDLFPEELTARQLADRHMAAAFRLDVYYTDKAYRAQRRSNGGSGFFVTPDGLAVTNYHTIEDAVQATVTLITGETFPVEKVLFYDAGADLALLRISRTSLEKTEAPFFSCLEIAEEPALRRGDPVYALGAPLGLTLAISDGVVSSTDHEVQKFGFPCIVNTADISHGSSGGALLNALGHVVGVTSGAYEAGNNLYISVPLTPVLAADWTVEGLTLREVVEEVRNAE